MGVRLPSVVSTTILNSPILTTAETIVVTSPAINLSLDFQALLIFWYANIAAAASTTSVIARLRRGAALTGTVINVASLTVATASAGFSTSGCYVDTPGAVAGQQYSLTLALSAASANSAVNDVALVVMGL